MKILLKVLATLSIVYCLAAGIYTTDVMWYIIMLVIIVCYLGYWFKECMDNAYDND